MNWLAHLLISPCFVEVQLGNLLADRLKGRPWPGASLDVQQGLLLHKTIDRLTDHHPKVIQARRALAPMRYLNGVVLDLLFDHLLCCHWQSFAKLPLERFVEAFFQQVATVELTLPDSERHFIHRLKTHEILTGYASWEGIALALSRLELRLSPRLRTKVETMAYLSVLEAQYDLLEGYFLDFFPELLREVVALHPFQPSDYGVRVAMPAE